MGEKLGLPVTITDAIRGRMRNRIYRVGIELEGGWTRLPRGTHVIRDGSVVFNRPGDAPIVNPPLVAIGELPSEPLSLEEFPKWMRTFYPQHVNDTCGMHVHMSFKNALTYSRTMSSRFPATIIAEVTKWATKERLSASHPIWGRLRGDSEYCQHIYDADVQISKVQKEFDHHREGHRYTTINYSWARYNTVECRLLPMMDTPERAIGAIQEIIDTTNAFLNATAKRERRERLEVRDDGGEDVEVRRVHI